MNGNVCFWGAQGACLVFNHTLWGPRAALLGLCAGVAVFFIMKEKK